MSHSRVVDVGAGGGAPRACPWLACAARAGLVRPPIPRTETGGLGGSSVSGISLACIDWVERIDWFGEGR